MNGKLAWLLGTVLAAACAGIQPGGGGEAYAPKGDPWGEPEAPVGEGGARTGGKTEGKAAADGRNDGRTGEPTVLEDLAQARARTEEALRENGQLKGDAAQLAAMVQQLKEDNKRLGQLAEQATATRAQVDAEMEKLRLQIQEKDDFLRRLADDVLAERIQRVRVERELILAKVSEAQQADDGGN